MGDCLDHEDSRMNENLDESKVINNCETKPLANIKTCKRVFKRQKRKFSALDVDSIQSNAVYSPDVSSIGTVHNRKIKKTKRKQLAVNIDIKKKNTYCSDATNSEIIYRRKVKKERKQKVVTLTADVFRSITSKLCCSPALYMLKDVNEIWSAIVNEQLRQWKRNGHSINVYQFFLDKNPLCTRFYDVNDKQNMKCFHNEVRKLCKMLKNIAEIEDDGDESGLRLENLSASALGWYHEYCDSRIARCPIILQEKLRDLMQHSFKSSTRFVYSKPLMKPSFFQTIVLSRVNQITCLDLGNIKLETVHPIFMNSGLINLKELVWNAACPSLLLSLPARNRLKILSLTSAESTMVGFPAIVQFTGLKKLYTGLRVPDGPTRFDLDVLLRSYQNFWNLNINYSDEAGDGVEVADSDLILSKMLNLRHISFWNAPEKVFTIMARRSLSFSTLQFGQLSQDLSRLCSLDSVMQALFKFNQPKYQIYQLNVDHLKLYLHAMPVISLDYYLPQLMMGLNESMWSIKSLDLFVHCSFGSSMPSSWSLEHSRKSSRSKMNNLTNFSLHIDGFCVLDDLNYHLPRSIKSVSISLVLPSTKASRAIKSLLKFIRQLSDLNSFPDLDELHLQVWGIRCAEQLLNCVSDYLSDVRKLSIICMPVREERNSLIDLLKNVANSCSRMNSLALSASMTKLLVEEYGDLYLSNWRLALAKLSNECGLRDSCELSIASLPQLDGWDNYVVKPEYPDVTDIQEEDAVSSEEDSSSSAGSDSSDTKDSFVVDDEIFEDEECDDEIEELDKKLEKESNRRDRIYNKKRSRIQSQSSNESIDQSDVDCEENIVHSEECYSENEEEQEHEINPFIDNEAEEFDGYESEYATEAEDNEVIDESDEEMIEAAAVMVNARPHKNRIRVKPKRLIDSDSD